MNPNDFQAFNQAIMLAQSGDKSQAYNRLKALQPTYPQDVKLLLWIAFTSPSLDEARRSIELASLIEGGNPQVQQARQWLIDEMSRQQALPHSTGQYLAVAQPVAPPPQVYDPNLVYRPPVSVAPAQAPLPYTVEVKPLKKAGLPIWAILLPLFAVVTLVAAFLLFQATAANSNNSYTVYSTPEDMFRNAGVGQQAQFYGRLTPNTELEGFGYVYYNWTGTFGNRSPVVVRFPRDSKFSPAVSNATYKVKVADRQAGFVVVDVQDVKQ